MQLYPRCSDRMLCLHKHAVFSLRAGVYGMKSVIQAFGHSLVHAFCKNQNFERPVNNKVHSFCSDLMFQQFSF